MSCKYVVFERWCLSIFIISHSHRKKKPLKNQHSNRNSIMTKLNSRFALEHRYGDEGKAGELITTEALQVHACVNTLQNQAAEQVRMLHRPQMESVVKDAERCNFRVPMQTS